MRLAVNLGYFGMGLDADNLVVAQEADRLGYAVAWVAEAYGSDVPSILGWVAGQTEHIGLGAAIMQIPARTPAMTAMTAATIDHISGGRMFLGLGVSGPQVSEGWHGVRFAAPLGRTREYVEIVRKALRRERLTYAGKHFTLPLPDGPGKAIKLTLPVRPDLPIYLAAVGPKNLELAGEIADGLLAIFFAPDHAASTIEPLALGRRRAGAGAPDNPMAGFDVVATVPVLVTDDLEAGYAAVAPYAALYVGGMGSREQNFYNQLATRMGFGQAAAEVQDLYLAGRHRDAADAVPREFIAATSIIGPASHVASRLRAYADAGVTTLAVSPFTFDRAERLQTLWVMQQALQESGLSDD
ncbi:LLM class F420-dependent oxidoreductase [Phycicoccus elongatus]|uniref:LLM class F420-dependent oxidoreductase n=1 Tax=Phycicoccus elongatus TaxID=101689 RepID=UPI002CFB7988|nr:LLM class F420-dependent oxidoreductase [Phycicoccus elongatus]HPQ73171.1 LLM class F420-dependent oxidoreductase [Phycicoccus elongatus]